MVALRYVYVLALVICGRHGDARRDSRSNELMLVNIAGGLLLLYWEAGR